MGPDRALSRPHRRTGTCLNNELLSRVRIRVVGIVQGVGFRPFVYRLATDLGLGGWVLNDEHGVLIEVIGTERVVTEFVRRVRTTPPPLAVIDGVTVELQELSTRSEDHAAFAIRSTPKSEISTSEPTVSKSTALVPADVAICAECLHELRDPNDRRYRHAFINCTDCGPRFTAITALPYERAKTTMAAFDMCEACALEFSDPRSRRFHAEPICCRECGPRLHFRLLGDAAAHESATSALPDDAAINAAIVALRDGLIVAVKGMGGYGLLVDASNCEAVQRLRERKHRDEKPFALQVASVDAARALVALSESEEQALCGPETPIVLARRLPGSEVTVCSEVAPMMDTLGVALPSTGLHYLLADGFGGPLVLTSGNVSDEPIVIDDNELSARLSGVADAVLGHDRRIHRRADDSVVREINSQVTVFRRARGYVPTSLVLPSSADGDEVVLGVGAELKNTVCLARGRHAFLSTHLGDLEHLATYRSFQEVIRDQQEFFGVYAKLIVHDLHPEYLSTKWALAQEVETLGVQHHHAHIASCLVENGLDGPVVGLGFDGHGFGPDGTLWGGEILVADLVTYRRVGHFAVVPVPGGSRAIREPWRMAVSYLSQAYNGDVPKELAVRARHDAQWSDVESVAAFSKTIRTSSVGRLFDAVAAILGVRDVSAFEGQAATALEQLAWRSGGANDRERSAGVEPIEITEVDDVLVLRPFSFVRSLAEAVGRGVVTSEGQHHVAWIAHRRIADAAVAGALRTCARSNLDVVALSGGVFQNALLTEMVQSDLERRGLRVITHRNVPPNDGGISLGQVAIGRAHLRTRLR